MAGLFGGSAVVQARRALLSWLPFLAAIPLLWLVQYFFADQPDWEYAFQNINHIGIAIILAVSLNLVNGLTGQFSIGHAGFMAVGAYGSLVVSYYGGVAPFGDVEAHRLLGGYALYLGSVVAGGLIASVAGLIVGLPSLRL